jgi:hypothetical protein
MTCPMVGILSRIQTMKDTHESQPFVPIPRPVASLRSLLNAIGWCGMWNRRAAPRQGLCLSRLQAGRWRGADRALCSRATANYVDFLERVKAWLPPDIELIYVFMDNLSAYPGTGVLLFSLAHPHCLLAPSCWHFGIV